MAAFPARFIPSIPSATRFSASIATNRWHRCRKKWISRSLSRPHRPCRKSSANASMPACAAVVISAGFKERGAEGSGLERADSRNTARPIARLENAGDRAELPGRHESPRRPERHLRARHGPARQRRIPQPERRAANRHSRLEPGGASRLQRDRFHRLHARCRLGRPDRLLRRRSRTREAFCVHGIGRRRALVSFRGARSGACANRSS